MNNILTMNALKYLEKKEVNLWVFFKKYLKDNQKTITTGLAVVCGNKIPN